MAREGQLARWREDAKARVAVRVAGQHEHRLGEVELACEPLHELGRDGDGVREDAQLVALERLLCEDVEDEEGLGPLERGRALGGVALRLHERASLATAGSLDATRACTIAGLLHYVLCHSREEAR